LLPAACTAHADTNCTPENVCGAHWLFGGTSYRLIGDVQCNEYDAHFFAKSTEFMAGKCEFIKTAMLDLIKYLIILFFSWMKF